MLITDCYRHRSLHIVVVISLTHALLRTWSEVLGAANRQHVTQPSMFDLGAAFDAVDHDILLMRLRHSVDWITLVLIRQVSSNHIQRRLVVAQ